MTRRACTKCGFTRDISEFSKDITSKSGFKSHCQPCRRESQRVAREIRDKSAKHHTTMPRWPSVEAFDAQRVEVASETLTHVEEHRLKIRLSQLNAQVKQLTQQLSDAESVNDIIGQARNEEVEPIRPRETGLSVLREATALSMASDWHIEESVKPEQVAGRNRYNLEISAQRMERFFSATRWAIDFNRQIFTIRDLILWLGGDLITNFLHEDNVISNNLSPPQALAYAHASIVEGIKFLLQDKELERIVVPCNDGNHGRMTKKMGSASRTQMSLETMLYGMIAQAFVDEPRVQFIIAEGEHLYYDVYGRTIRFTHGDSTKYGGGIGGIMIPIYKAMSRWDTVRRADLTVMGHWHQRICLPDLMVNGSLIGYNSYAMTIGARFEPPSQNFALLEPQRFRSVDLPLWVSEMTDDDTNPE